MSIYNGSYLTILFQRNDNLFIQYWNKSPNSLEEFREEMLVYTELYKKYRPGNTLWLQQNFTLNLDTDACMWIETHVNIPCKEYGNEKWAFVMSRDALAHMQVTNAFDVIESCIDARYFSSIQDAATYVKGAETNHDLDAPAIKEISFEGTDNENDSIIKIKTSSGNLLKTIQMLQDQNEQHIFMQKHLRKFQSLSTKEKEVFWLYTGGKKHQQIANELFISLHTVRTHWRNVKNKLEIQAFDQALKYAASFDQN